MGEILGIPSSDHLSKKEKLQVHDHHFPRGAGGQNFRALLGALASALMALLQVPKGVFGRGISSNYQRVQYRD